MKFHQKLLLCVGKEHHGALIMIYVMMLLMAAIEAVCTILFLPFLAIIENADKVQDYAWLVWVLERLEQNTQTSAIIVCCVMLFIAYLVKNIFTLFYKFTQAKFVRELHAQLALRLLRKYLESDYIKHISRNSADLIRNINQDTNSIFTNIVRSLLAASVEGIVALGLLALLLYQNVMITVMAIVIFGLMGTFVYRSSQRYTYRYGQMSRQSMAQMIKWTIQSLGSLKETKVMNKEDYFLARYNENVEIYQEASVKYAVIYEVPRLAIEVLGIFTVLLMTLVLLSQASQENALPTLGLFAIAAFRLLPSLTRIISSLSLARFHRSALDHVAEELDFDQQSIQGHHVKVTPQRELEPIEFHDEVTLEHISFAYEPGRAPVIDDCSLTIKKGQTVALVGTSGAGKTTLVDLLLGLLTPDAGQIKVDGQPVGDRVRAWQRQIGYISQPVYMLNDTVLRNVAFGLFDHEIDEERIWAALEQAQLKETIEALPGQLMTEIGESGVKLSGGQRQRIGIARVLYHNPQILVFDEATSALDNETEAEITRAIELLSKQKTIVLIAHRLSTIQHSSVIFMLDHGKVIARGTHDELMATCPAFHKLATASSNAEAAP